MSPEQASAVAAYLGRARWFGGKGRPFEVTGSRRLELADRVVVELVSVRFDSGETDLYQLPLTHYAQEQHQLDHALVGRWHDDQLGEVWAYDALHDHDATPVWLRGFTTGTPVGDVAFHRVGAPELDPESRGALLVGEQSNSSVAFGEQSLMKLFRRLTAGHNPDVEILTALTAAGNEHVAALYGWCEALDPRQSGGGPDTDEPLHLGILQQFLRTATDGFELALASVRSLLGDETVEHAADSGGDFAAEAERLGLAVAELHTALASAFPTDTWEPERLAGLADAMAGRLDDALAVVPTLAGHAGSLRRLFDAVRTHEGPVRVQRVHGDLHLGQTLRTVRNWKIIDFEGEPAKPLPQRRLVDSPWRDVAGMLRSFDYAAELFRLDHDGSSGAPPTGALPAGTTAVDRARDWAGRNTAAFLDGYRSGTGEDPGDTLLRAYVADKAIYEAVYEARHRRAWLPVPLAALDRLAHEAERSTR